MKKLYLLFGYFIIAIALLQSCSNKKKNRNLSQEYSKYVASYTSGIISKKSNLIIRFVEAPKLSEVGKEVEASILNLSPNIKGKTYWKNNKTIIFSPEKAFESDQQYTVNLKLAKLFDIDKKLSEMNFQFKTIKQDFVVSNGELQSYGSNQMEYQKYTSIINFADHIDESELDNFIEANYNDKKLKVKYQSFGDKDIRIIIDSLRRGKSASQLKLKYIGEKININRLEEKEITVESIGVFKFQSAKVDYQKEQKIEILFSDPLNPNQDLRGLIHIENYSDLNFKIDGNKLIAWPKKRIEGEKTLYIEQGIQNTMKYGLSKTIKKTMIFEMLKPELRLIGKGVILPSSAGMFMSFKAVGLKAVDLRIIEIFKDNISQFFQENEMTGKEYLKRTGRLILDKKINLNTDIKAKLSKWNAFNIDISKHININPGSIYRVELRFRKEYTLSYKDTRSEIEKSIDKTKSEKTKEREDKYWDTPGWYSEYYRPSGYIWREQNNPMHVSYYNSDRFVRRNLFASDLGIIVKKGKDNSYIIYASNLISAQPEADVSIQLLNYQSQEIANTKTDKNGFAAFDIKNHAFLLIAKKGDNYSYLKLKDGNSLSLSNFNVGGSRLKKGLNAFIYTERGAWRPGDNIHLCCVVDDSQNKLPENHPVIFELRDPLGKLTDQQILTKSIHGFYYFKTKTSTESKTGTWQADIQIGDIHFSKSLKIETIKPNRLKINIDFPSKTLKSNQKNQTAKLNVKWLHGSPGGNMQTKVNCIINKTSTSFKAYKSYIFDDQSKKFYSENKQIFDGKTNENGDANINLELNANKNAPGMLNASFITKVFEKGGGFSINMQKIKFAPYSHFVGIKMPESKAGWYLTDTDYNLKLAYVDSNGKASSSKKLRLKVYKIDWRWWWDSDEDDLGYYINRRSTRVVIDKKLSIVNGDANIKINLPYKTWRDYGRYYIRVIDEEGGHSSGLIAYFSDYYGKMPGGSSNSNMLSLTSDKNKYEVGEIAKIKIPSTSGSRALISIENGTKVLDAYTIETNKTETNIEIEITEDMVPNFFLSASLIQPHAQKNNDLPIRMYGTIPIFAENKNSHLQPKIEIPEVLEPEQNYTVKISEKNKKPMTYTLAIVDEGLLDLTNYRTPNLWNHFYKKQALGVKTWDMYDYVIGAYGAMLESAFATGGDEAGKSKKMTKANRFKPVVEFIGPFHIEAGETQEHNIKMPNYVGAVKAMVIAAENKAYGKAEKSVPVRRPLMVLSDIPRKLSPNEELNLPVTVFAMDEKIKNAKISVKLNDQFVASDNLYKSISFNKPGEKVINFKLKLKNKLGIGKIEIIAKSANIEAKYNMEVDIINPNPLKTKYKAKLLENNESWGLNIEKFGVDGSNKAILELSSIPPIDLSRRLDYLIQYPHGCIEQTTSSVFPQIYLSSLINLSQEQKTEINNNIKEALTRFLGFQTNEGGFSYWQGGHYVSEWGTNYAGHFILNAEEKGYQIPTGLKESWIKFQKRAAKLWRYSTGRSSDLIQAYRLYVLALFGHPQLSAMNRMREMKHLSDAARWRLAATYAISSRENVANELINGLSTEVKSYFEHSASFGSSTRDKAMILETLCLLNKKEKAFELVKDLSDKLSSDKWMSTQTTAYSLLSIAEYVENINPDEKLNFSYDINAANSKDLISDKLVHQINLSNSNITDKINLTNNSSNPLFARLICSGIPQNPDADKIQDNILMSIEYLDSKGQKIDISDLKQTTDILAKIRIKNNGNIGDYEQMALSVITPSGWEIINTRTNDIESGIENSNMDYQDIKDDRIYTYFSLNMNETKVFSFMFNATYAGKFMYPSINCQAMYDYRVKANIPGKWVKISQ
ncbi:MAG: MG2 domain-containing protein [Marinifilaceae bacterium]|jgi:uncharacterized protein YfaS (alpha-2-macroglobulin family)|nr:MG2 domain-containing protein [Marinifilaceae bacterium]